MSGRWLIAALTATLCTTALAQQQVDERRGGRWAAGGNWTNMMFDRMVRDLGLDEEQRSAFDAILEAHANEFAAMSERFQAFREASEAGDQETLDKLRAEMRDGGGPEQTFGAVIDELEPLLRDDQLERLDRMRERMEEGRARMERIRRITEDLPRDLELDEEQRAHYDALIDEGRERMREQWGAMRPMFEQMRAAREAGDDQLLADLERQMEEMRPDEEGLLSEFFDRLGETLRPEQQQVLQQYREEMVTSVRGDDRKPGDARTILRLARRLRLDAGQKDTLREIERETREALRRAGRRDREAQAAIADNVRQQVLKMLDEQQAARFQEELARLERRGR